MEEKKREHFDHRTVDAKWQQRWLAEKTYRTTDLPSVDKEYVLDMFPYPSGEGLHVGHPIGYIGTDILARYFRAKGKNVLHPMGYDAFGLPAENYAIKTGLHPVESTNKSIERFRKQMQMIGLSYDWDREVNSSDPSYYRWTQWLFLKLYEMGLAYRAKAPVNWCPKDQTVLANEQVKDGKCERCDSVVEQKNLEQWFFKMTQYAEEYLSALDDLDWPEPIKLIQRNWIGKSEGAKLTFQVKGSHDFIEVFTTRPDTLFGATYLVLAPEHPLIADLATTEHKELVERYVATTKTKKQLERKAIDKPKTGVFTGRYAINPVNNEELPIWIADYVLMDYGTGAIMAVPAHDERDWAFAHANNLPIRQVITAPKEVADQVYAGQGKLINSGNLSGLNSETARQKITALAGGKLETSYRLRDWLVSRQRYWGAPIPMIVCNTCGYQPVPEDQLPVRLPMDVDFRPTGESPLARSQEFHQGVSCPKCKKSARREVDTMDTFVDSSWYFLRYVNPHDEGHAFNQDDVNRWLPVDWYVGGAEHAVLHLLYSRFFTKALADGGYLAFREPFRRLRNQGLIRGEDNRKMSKRWGNVVNPDDVVRDYGADALRCFEMFMGPFNDSKPWSTSGLIGVRRWLDRVWRLQDKVSPQASDSETTQRALSKAVVLVTEMIEEFRFNTCISQFMILTNILEKEPAIGLDTWKDFLQLLAPFAPHFTNELWQQVEAKDSLDSAPWPTRESAEVLEETFTLPIQVNGKRRGEITVRRSMTDQEMHAQAQQEPAVSKYLEGKEIKKIILVPGRIINIIV